MNSRTRQGLGTTLTGLLVLLAAAYVAGNAGSIGVSKIGSLFAWLGLAAIIVGIAVTTWGLVRDHTKSSSGVRSS